MLVRVSGEFENLDAAESVMSRIRASVTGIKKITILSDQNRYRKASDLISYPYTAVTDHFTLIQTQSLLGSQNYMTETVYTEHAPTEIPEPERRIAVTLQILCDASVTHSVSSLMTAMGGLQVKVKQ